MPADRLSRVEALRSNGKETAVKSLSTAFWFTIGSGLLAGWLGIGFAVSEGSGVMAGAVALAAAGFTFGLLGIAIANILGR